MPGCFVEQVSYRIDSVPLEVFARSRLRELAGERICYRSGPSGPKVFARSRLPGCFVEQVSYCMDSVPQEVFARSRLRELAGEHFCYRSGPSGPEVFAPSQPGYEVQ